MMTLQRITPCLWFDNQAEEAARFYTGIFKNSKVTQISHYGEAGQVHGQTFGCAGARSSRLNESARSRVKS